MRTLFSKPVKKKAMQAADAELLNADFATHDHLLHTMVSDMLHPERLGKESMFLRYRGKGLATNHVRSLEDEAKGIVSVAKEALAFRRGVAHPGGCWFEPSCRCQCSNVIMVVGPLGKRVLQKGVAGSSPACCAICGCSS